MSFLKRKTRYKPLYKKFIKLKANVQNRNKIFKFKKQKWQTFIFHLNKASKYYNRFKPYDQNRLQTPRFASRGNSFKKKFLNTLFSKKKFNLFYGGLNRKYLKKKIKLIVTKNQTKKEFKNFNLRLLEFFESRLDSILYRAKFTSSIRNSRQIIVHGHILVNNKLVKNKSYIVKQGDLISINPQSYQIIRTNIRKADFWPIPPKHLSINYKTLEIIFGDIKYTNFSNYFSFELDIETLITHYLKH